jgi:acyl-CoA synthetase (NDP forming)
MDVLLDAEEVDAVLTVFTHVAVTDPEQINRAVVASVEGSSKPVVATEVGCADRSIPIGDSGRSLPSFTFPESAAAALGAAYRYAQIRSDVEARPVRVADVEASAAREVVAAVLADGREWLAPAETSRLLAQYGLRLCPQRVVHTLDDAVRAGEDLGYPVAAKLAASGIHKSDIGGVRLHLRDAAALHRAYTELADASPDSDSGVLVQPMIDAGTEIIVGVARDPQFGSLVMVGAGGVLVDLLDDRAFRLAPISARDAETMIGQLRVGRLLDGYRGAPVVSRSSLCDILVRVSTLADDLPEIAELDINPLVCSGDGIVAVDVRVRVEAPQTLVDPLLRQLRRAHR